MSKKLQPVRGTHDILSPEAAKRRALVDAFARIAAQYGFGEFEPPIFEFSEVFHRTLGDSSDIVTKETYSFEDRGGESITLRPEFTAAIARAFISNGLQQALPVKWWYQGPAFRYERPQKGRQRQFTQVGVELIGPSEPQADVEVIALAQQFLSSIGLEQDVTLELNSLGDEQSRADYRDALVTYYQAHRTELSVQSLVRLEKNPLRILDSKDEGDRAINANAPKLSEHFTDAAQNFFKKVTSGLTDIGIAYQLNDNLVRGLDYYNHTVFEFVTDKLGAQGTVLAGGRYDGLIEMMGGQPTPGIGFAAGIERLLLLASDDIVPNPEPLICVVPIAEEQQAAAWKLAHELRSQGLTVDIAYKGNAGKRMKQANKLGAAYAVVIGEDELASGNVTLKKLQDGSQQTIDQHALVVLLKEQQ